MRILALLLLPLLLQESPSIEAILAKFKKAHQVSKTRVEIQAAAKTALEALDALAAGSKDSTESAHAWLRGAAQMCAILDDDKGAVTRFRKILDTVPTFSDLATVRVLLADALTSDGNDAGARDVYAEFLKVDAADPRVHEVRIRVAQSLILEKRFEDSLAAFNAIRQDYKGKREEWPTMLIHAQAHQFMEKTADARGLIEGVIRQCPDIKIAEFAKQILANMMWIGKAPPAVDEKDLQGRPFSIAAQKGKAVCLYFFATGPDGHSTLEAIIMKKLRATFPAADLSIMGVCLDRERQGLDDYVKDMEADWPIHHDGGNLDGKIAKLYNLKDLPMVALIDRTGVIRFVNPLFSSHGRELRLAVGKLVAEKP